MKHLINGQIYSKILYIFKEVWRYFMNLYQETKFIMNKFNITANKSYGQIFLTD